MYTTVVFLLGFFSCLLTLYLVGTYRHQGHGHKVTGPSSKSQLHENVVPIVRKG